MFNTLRELPKKKNKYVKWILAFLIFLFALLDVVKGVFALVGFGIFALVIVFCDSRDVLFVILFSLSFANIFKLSPSSQSIFTFVTLGYICYQLFLGRSCHNEYWLAFILLVIFISLQGIMSMNVLRAVKFVANFLFLYFALYDAQGNETDLFLGFIVSVILSSLVSWSGMLPNLDRYLGADTVRVNGQQETRFTGFYQDPNYYCVNVIIALCLVVILYYRKDISLRTAAIFAGSLFAFAILTYSKSAILMLVFPVSMFFYANSKNARYGIQIACLIGLFLFCLYAIAGKIDFLSTILSRFQGATSIERLTTGRTVIWARYMRSFSESVLHLLVGNGTGARLVGTHAAHNTYIDMVHYLGLIGIFIMFRLLVVATKVFHIGNHRRNYLNYSVMLVIMVMYFFLSELFYFDLPFHFLLAIIVLNMNLSKEVYRPDFYNTPDDRLFVMGGRY